MSRGHRWAAVVAVAALAAACSSDDASVDTSPVAGEPSSTSEPEATTPPTSPATDVPSRSACDSNESRRCLLPWPNDALTVTDPSSPTGVRLALPADAMPRNVDGVPIDVTDQNRADGFSPGSAVLLFVPDVDVVRTGLATSGDIAPSLFDDAPIAITDLNTGERWPYFAELDAQAPPGEQLLMLHPAVAWTETHRYQVDVGRLVTSSGAPVAAPPPARWQFTIASADSLSGRLRHMRDETFAALGDGVPDFTVDSVTGGAVRTIDGTFQIPNYLSGDGGTGQTFVLDDGGMPTINTTHPTYTARYRCVVPSAPADPVPIVVYGHGLLGGRNEVDFFATFASLGSAGACATDWLGMASEDIPTVVNLLMDESLFNQQADRLQQGQIAFQLLARLANNPEGFGTDPAFADAGGRSVIAPDSVVFVGNSQGGILGGAATAITSEWSRAVLGVPAMNYSLLLPRSSDWPQFQEVFDASYLDPVDRVLAIQLVQLLWDRGENQGYAQHLTSNPYEGVTAKTVLLVGAFGDHQVANVATNVLARTIGARIHTPTLRPRRTTAPDPFWNIDPIESYPFRNSAYVMWDYGTPEPPAVNRAPTSPEYGADPHGAGSEETGVLIQALTFLLSGDVIDVCGAQPCVGRQIDQP